MTVRIEGLQNALAAFDRVRRAARGRALADAAQAGLEPVLADARLRAPERTGDLRRSLGIQVWEASDTRAELEVFADPRVAFYAAVVEYDHPFLRPAWDSNVDEARSRVESILRSRIEGAARSAAGAGV